MHFLCFYYFVISHEKSGTQFYGPVIYLDHSGKLEKAEKMWQICVLKQSPQALPSIHLLLFHT